MILNSIDAARAYLLGNYDLPDLALNALLGLLAPAMFLTAPEQGDERPGTFLGGQPQAGAGFDWPLPPVAGDVGDLADRGGPEVAPLIRYQLEARTPYSFLGQVDLTAAAGLGPVAADLPPTGRLLFFYDTITGPYETSTRVGRVIWDQTPASALTGHPPPAAQAGAEARLTELGNAAVASVPHPDPETLLQETLAQMRAAGVTMTEDEIAELQASLRAEVGGDAYTVHLSTPMQPMRVVAGLQFPWPGYLGERFEALTPEVQDVLYEISFEGSDLVRLLGTASPEQDDPLLDAVVAETYGGALPEGTDWKDVYDGIRAETADWRLLMQIPMADWSPDWAEGTVYFMIRREDLRNRNFDRVVVSYQQT